MIEKKNMNTTNKEDNKEGQNLVLFDVSTYNAGNSKTTNTKQIKLYGNNLTKGMPFTIKIA